MLAIWLSYQQVVGLENTGLFGIGYDNGKKQKGIGTYVVEERKA